MRTTSKTMTLLCAAVSAVAFAFTAQAYPFRGGYASGGKAEKPKIPQGAVAAAYVDLENGIPNVLDFAEEFSKALPAAKRDAFNAEKEKSLQALKKITGSENGLKWAAVSVHPKAGRKPKPRLCVAICVEDGDKVEAFLKSEFPQDASEFPQDASGKAKISGEEVLAIGWLGGAVRIGNIFVTSGSTVLLEKIVRVYKGEEEPDSAFEPLSALEDGAILRLFAPDASVAIRRLGLREGIESLARDSGMGLSPETIMAFRRVQLDFRADIRKIGAEFSVVTDSDMVEKSKRLIESTADFAFKGLSAIVDREARGAEHEAASEILDMLSDSLRIRRSGETIYLSVGVDTRKALKIKKIADWYAARSDAYAASFQGQKLFGGMLIACMRNGKSIWPKTTGKGKRVWNKAYANSCDYFTDLFDVKNANNPTKQKKEIMEDANVLFGFGVPAPADPAQLRPENVMWSIAGNLQDSYPDILPVLVSANVDPSMLLSKYCGDSKKRIPIGKAAGIDSGLSFNDTYAVIIRKNGAMEWFKAEEFTYDKIYKGNAFDISYVGYVAIKSIDPENEPARKPFCYLTPRGIAHPSVDRSGADAAEAAIPAAK